ncbi:aminotransferase class I/II-fold pyridoxal phosphate-dependent enzyme [Candidatus Parcubacteria bacterium]|nr:aminotransferase class I/II-fold pyridoxal phosphate-dependent enzyme [Candidatus Parcubacteria bacterium]
MEQNKNKGSGQIRGTRLPESGENIFQRIKKKTEEAEARGIEVIRLSIGQPGGPALPIAKKAAAEAIMSDEESMHEYQDNGSPGVPNFAERFVQAHIKTNLQEVSGISCMPIPGIKPVLGPGILACDPKLVATMSEPGYPTPAKWCGYLKVPNYSLPLTAENKFLFSAEDIEIGTDLVMINFPNNPSGQVAPRKWLEELCGYCQENNIRLLGDAAYGMLIHDSKDRVTLTDVAINFPDLSFCEMFSVSKEIGNGTGWRVGAITGSEDFIEDFGKIKGETDSGAVAATMAGAIYAIENDQEGIERYNQMYAQRTRILVDILSRRGMQLVLQPKATFFSLWEVPHEAFGRVIRNAEHFNNLMIKETGIVGVPFGDGYIGDDYIRYSVAGYPMEETEKASSVDLGFEKASVIR